jgi:1,4-dihydroxy-2-naphthoate octaprenyltransferase
LLVTLPFGMLAFTNLLAVTWPDREADATVGKFTLATKWPAWRLRLLYWIVAGSAFLLLWFLPDAFMPPLVKRASLAALPIAIWGGLTYTRWRNPFPSVAAMVVMLVVQLGAWWLVVYVA